MLGAHVRWRLVHPPPARIGLLIRRGELQVHGRAVCGGRAMDAIALIRRAYPAIEFHGALAVCRRMDRSAARRAGDRAARVGRAMTQTDLTLAA